MKIIVKIDADTPEGRQVIDYLKTFPEVVTFEDTLLTKTSNILTAYATDCALEFVIKNRI